jgi:hypothetical protein
MWGVRSAGVGGGGSASCVAPRRIGTSEQQQLHGGLVSAARGSHQRCNAVRHAECAVLSGITGRRQQPPESFQISGDDLIVLRAAIVRFLLAVRKVRRCRKVPRATKRPRRHHRANTQECRAPPAGCQPRLSGQGKTRQKMRACCWSAEPDLWSPATSPRRRVSRAARTWLEPRRLLNR